MSLLFTRTVTGLKRNKRFTQFLTLFSFLITFALARVTTHLQKVNLLPSQHGHLHIHHLVFGIVFLLISGYVGLSFWNHPKVRQWMAVVFGVGAALTIDEFALWVYLRDVYWEREGRLSIDAIILTVVILIIVLLITEAHDIFISRQHKEFIEKMREDAKNE